MSSHTKKKLRDIVEAYHSMMKTQYSNGPFEIYKNSNSDELHRIMKNSEYKEARGLLSKDSAYVWDSHREQHLEMKMKLKNSGHKDADSYHHVLLYKGVQGSKIINYDNEKSKREDIENHPWTKRVFSE